jgi:hypothetical protein
MEGGREGELGARPFSALLTDFLYVSRTGPEKKLYISGRPYKVARDNNNGIHEFLKRFYNSRCPLINTRVALREGNYCLLKTSSRPLIFSSSALQFERLIIGDIWTPTFAFAFVTRRTLFNKL